MSVALIYWLGVTLVGIHASGQKVIPLTRLSAALGWPLTTLFWVGANIAAVFIHTPTQEEK